MLKKKKKNSVSWSMKESEPEVAVFDREQCPHI